jgi:hypothetical protein
MSQIPQSGEGTVDLSGVIPGQEQQPVQADDFFFSLLNEDPEVGKPIEQKPAEAPPQAEAAPEPPAQKTDDELMAEILNRNPALAAEYQRLALEAAGFKPGAQTPPSDALDPYQQSIVDAALKANVEVEGVQEQWVKASLESVAGSLDPQDAAKFESELRAVIRQKAINADDIRKSIAAGEPATVAKAWAFDRLAKEKASRKETPSTPAAPLQTPPAGGGPGDPGGEPARIAEVVEMAQRFGVDYDTMLASYNKSKEGKKRG